MADDDEPVVVYTGPTVAAGFLKGLLDDAGLQVFIWGEGTRASWGSPLDPMQQYGAKVVVPRRDLEKAKPIVQQFLDEGLFPPGATRMDIG